MALKRIDDKDGKDLVVPFYRVEIHVHRVNGIDVRDNLQLDTVFRKQDLDLSLSNTNDLLAAVGQPPIEEVNNA